MNLIIILTFLIFTTIYLRDFVLAEKKKSPKMSSELLNWIKELKDSVSENNDEEINRIYCIIMNMLHADVLLKENDHEEVLDLIYKIIKDREKNVVPRNTFVNPHYDIC